MKCQSSNTKLIHDFDFDEMTNNKRYSCPECSAQSKRKNPKDIQYYKDTKLAYCHKCETTFFEYKPFDKEKQYVAPEWKNSTELTDKAVKWFESRMISQKTLNKLKVCSKVEYMPQFQKETEVICFPMYVGDVVKNVKYRGAQKSFKLYSGAELVWYNANAIIDNKEIIIVEGEIDLLSWYECGIENVISVPNGANKNLEYLNNSIAAFEHVEKIYLATDQDTKGIELRDELIRRFGAEKCYLIGLKQYKDSNSYLMGDGDLKPLLKEAKEVPVKGAVKVNSLYSDIVDLYENGVKPGEITGNEEIDKFVTWELGRISMVTGTPGSGKSEFVDYVISRLNKLHGWKATYFTPENYPLKYHYAKIHEKYSGQKFKKETDNTDFLSIYEYVKDNYYYILDEDDMSLDKILEITKRYIKQCGIKILVIDPYNVLDHSMGNNTSETQYISTFLDKLIKFTRFNNILTFLIAHPKKMQRGEVPNLYDISGSAHFYNKTDYGFTVNRNRDENGLMNNDVDVYWQKIKFKHLGEQGKSEFVYNYKNGRFEPRSFGDIGKWDYSNWLTEKEPASPDTFIEPNKEFEDETEPPF